MKRSLTYLLVGQLALSGHGFAEVYEVPPTTTALVGGTITTVAPPAGVTNQTLLFVRGTYYQPFSGTLPIGTAVYLDAGSSQLRATQRSLGYREVDYKKQFFKALTASTGTLYSDKNGNSIYSYGDASTSTTLAGYWTKKNLPVIAGVDGNGYITDGHHTTAGYLATSYLATPGAALIPGYDHIVLGTIVTNPAGTTPVGDSMWGAFSSTNNGYLYGNSGNQLLLPSDPGYDGLQPILASAVPMPVTPGTVSMGNDLYRSLTWASVDAIVKTATSVSGSKIAGYKKVDSTSLLSAQPDVNFVEFFWADFLRNRVVWNDSAKVTSENLLNAPASFYAAAANAIALSKSELYLDQNGRSLLDYTDDSFSANTKTWAKASIKNGLAAAGDTYNLFLSDDASVQGDIMASGVDGVTTKLNINTGSLITVSGALKNLSSIVINQGATMTIDWKDAAVNAVAQNKSLSIAAGTGNVIFAGDNDYSKLETLVIQAGELAIDTSSSTNTPGPEINAVISGAGSLRKVGNAPLIVSGANTLAGGFGLDEGQLTLASSSAFDGTKMVSSPVGLGTLLMKEGTSLAFDENVRLGNTIKAVSDTGGSYEGVGILFNVASNSVDLSGNVISDVPVNISGSEASVLTLSNENKITGALTIDTLTLRVAHPKALSMETIAMQSGATIQAGTSFSSAANLLVDGHLDAGESLLEWTGVISGAGRLTILGQSGGAVRLSGLNTYTGGTEVNNTRVEVGVNASDAETDGGDISGRAFGAGEVVLNAGVMAFVVPSAVPNAITLNGSSGVDVGSNFGHLSGVISGDGSLSITGNRDGALMLSGANSYNGETEVEGTTLRIFSTAGSSIFGTSTSSVYLNDAVLQILPDVANPLDVATFGTRGLSLGTMGGQLDATDNNVRWDGTISGPGKLFVNASIDNTVEFTGANTYLGGTEITGGSLKFTANSNLGDASGGIMLSGGGLLYAGTQDLTFSRNVAVKGSGLINALSQRVTLTGAVAGSGDLIVGDSSTTGVLAVGSSSSGFAGTTVVNGGALLVTHADALKGSTLEIPGSGGSVSFTTTQANLAGLAGDGTLSLPSGFALSIGATGKSSLFTGSLNGTTATFSKVGLGTFTLAGSSNVLAAAVAEGALSLTSTGTLASGTKLTLGSGASLIVSGTQDLRNNFDLTALTGVSAGASIVFYGSQGSVLTLPSAVYEKVSFVTNGQGRLDTVSNGTVTTVSGGAVSRISSIGQVILTRVEVATAFANGGKVSVDTSGGDVDLNANFSQLTGGGTSSMMSAPAGGNALIYTSKPLFDAVIDAPLKVPASVNQVVLLPLQGTNTLTVSAGAKVKLVESVSFSGATSLGIGASAELTGSYGSTSQPGLISLSSGASVSVNPSIISSEITVPAFSGESGTVGLKAGFVILSGSNANFGGTISIEKGVSVTVKGDLPKGTLEVKDATVPLKVDTSSGNITLPGKISGDGAVELSGSGKMTMTAGASIQTAALKLGKTASDKPILDVSNLAGGLALTSSQTLSGGGTLMGSVQTNGAFKPGNSPGVFTVAKSTLIGADGTVGGNLVLNSTSTTEIEYGKRLDNSQYNWDQVVVGGSLSIVTGARIVVSPYVGTDGSGIQYVSSRLPSRLLLTGVFSSGSLTLGSVLPELANASYVMNTSWVRNGNALDILIERASYGAKVSPQHLRNLGNYLTDSASTANSALTSYLSVLDSAANQAQLEAGLQALSSPLYAEAQRLSLRRTSAISATVQGRLSPNTRSAVDGWSAFSESYGWSFHRESSAGFSSWNGNTFGEVAGVERRLQGLSIGVFGATGYSTASFSGPGSTLKGDSFHGGAFAQVNAGSLFLDASFLAGCVEQKSSRQVSLGGLGGTLSSRFDTSEYAGHLRAGWLMPNVAGAFQLTPSFAVICNGYAQGKVNESGSDSSGSGIVADKNSASAWQTRLGSDLSRAFKISNAEGLLSTSLHWIHDFDGGARSTLTRFQGAGLDAGGFESLGSAVGPDAFEFGVSASVDVTRRTTLRASGNWQVREGSSQPGFNVGISVKF